MLIKKVFGVVFLALAGLIFLSMLSQFSLVVKELLNFFKLFTGDVSPNDLGYSSGYLLAFVLLALFGYVLASVGLKWVKKKARKTPRE